jgi:hypothetical protein
MTVALFQSMLKTNEGETVWGSLKQKIVEAAEAPAHITEGWFESAQDALDDHELTKMEGENAKLQEQIAAEQVKLDGRTSAAKALKAKSAPVVEAPVDPNAVPAASEPVAPVTDSGTDEVQS